MMRLHPWPKNWYKNMVIHKGDTVQIMVGKDRGKTGKVLRADIKEGGVVVDGLNLFKKHQRPKKQGEKGQVVSVPRPLNISNVLLYCSSCRQGRRVGFRIEVGNKVRVCRKCKATI